MSLQFALLGLLGYKPMTGYDLKKMFDESINNFWAASLSQIYRELGDLDNKGYIDSVIQPQSDRPDKKIYNITDAGRDAFKNWIVNFPERLSKETRDEFTLRVFFGSKLSREDMIEQFKRFKEEKLNDLRKIESLNIISEKYVNDINLFGNDQLYWKFVLRRAHLTIDMLIHWVDECVRDLESEEER